MTVQGNVTISLMFSGDNISNYFLFKHALTQSATLVDTKTLKRKEPALMKPTKNFTITTVT